LQTKIAVVLIANRIIKPRLAQQFVEEFLFHVQRFI
jgi:hypothetical protein